MNGCRQVYRTLLKFGLTGLLLAGCTAPVGGGADAGAAYMIRR